MGTLNYTQDFDSPLPPGWTALVDQGQHWSRFEGKFGFRPGLEESAWPAIREPSPSITFDLTVPSGVDGAWESRFNAINAEALRCFVTEFASNPTFVVLDWQHPGYTFNAAIHASTWDAEWRVPVHPNGDYYIFLREDLSEGTFGHPWERTLCVFGERLVNSLGRTLETWLPVLRRDGRAPGPEIRSGWAEPEGPAHPDVPPCTARPS